jgi:hypothetical protein
LHELKLGGAFFKAIIEATGEALDVFLDTGSQVSVGISRSTSRDNLDHGHDLV